MGIAPENPASTDVVNITLTGEWFDSCVPEGSSISMVGNDIYLELQRADLECYGCYRSALLVALP